MTAVENIIKVKKSERCNYTLVNQFICTMTLFWLRVVIETNGEANWGHDFSLPGLEVASATTARDRQPKVCNAFWGENEVSRDDGVEQFPCNPLPGCINRICVWGGRHMFWHSLPPCFTSPLSFLPSPSYKWRNVWVKIRERSERNFFWTPHYTYLGYIKTYYRWNRLYGPAHLSARPTRWSGPFGPGL